MDNAEGWNELDDYSLFLPDDSYNLFGQHNVDLDFCSFLAPAFEETNSAFNSIECDGREGFDSALPDFDFPSQRAEESQKLIPNPEAELLVSTHTSASSSNLARSPKSDDRRSRECSAACRIENENLLKTTNTKRKLLAAFSVTSGREVRLHSRKRYHEGRKREVALHRVIGVCLHCKLRKVAVSSISNYFCGEV
jgi:hypothetical protein